MKVFECLWKDYHLSCKRRCFKLSMLKSCTPSSVQKGMKTFSSVLKSALVFVVLAPSERRFENLFVFTDCLWLLESNVVSVYRKQCTRVTT